MTREIDPYPFNPIQNLLGGRRIPQPTQPAKIIYTLGYRQQGAEEHLKRFTQQGYHIIDVRRFAGSRFKPAYNRRQLEARFGSHYTHVRELGNKNYPNKPYALVDQEAGINKATAILSGVPGVILLCACEHECHSAFVAELLHKRVPESHIIHLGEKE